MALQTDTISAIDTYWQTFFGCPVPHIDNPQTIVVPHAALDGYSGIFLFRRMSTLIISLPRTFDAIHRVQLLKLVVTNIDDPVTIAKHITVPIDHLIGPAFIGYADSTAFQPHHASAVRLLRPTDATAWSSLRDACSAIDWEHGGSPFGEQHLAGYMADGHLVALAGYKLWGTNIAHIAVVTHPSFRGKGYGKGVVSLLSETVLKAGLIPQYRTLCSNTPSMHIAATLGFMPYAESIAIRLR